MTSRVTIADVARLAGVSAVTVSKTLNNTGRISDDTRARVLRAVQDLGYIANPAARSLRGARSNLIGMVIPELMSPYFAELARAAAESASEAGLDLGVFTTSRDPARERQRVAALTGGMADGVIIVVPTDDATHLATSRRAARPSCSSATSARRPTCRTSAPTPTTARAPPPATCSAITDCP